VAQLVYIDETGSSGRGASRQPLLRLVGVVVDEGAVAALSAGLSEIEQQHCSVVGVSTREFHGTDLWHGSGRWAGLSPDQRMAIYEDAIALLSSLRIWVSYSSIHKQRLEERWGSGAADNAYVLALQFLLEKIDPLWGTKKIVVADEAKEHELRAIGMVANLQTVGYGAISGAQLTNVIDTIHFVDSRVSAGVQMADLIAFLFQRADRGRESHPAAQEGRDRMLSAIADRCASWRETWPTATSVYR
jgi:hypothetical protein